MIMLTFDKILYYYKYKLWNKAQVWDAVNTTIPKISQEQYTEITGDNYPIERPSENLV